MNIVKRMGWLVLPVVIGLLAGCSVERSPVDPLVNGVSQSVDPSREFMPGEIMNAVDNVKLMGSDGSETTYEDAEDGSISRWFVLSNSGLPSLTNVYAPDVESRVIQFFDNNTATWYALGNGSTEFSEAYWNNTTQFTIQWDMRFNVYFVARVIIITTDNAWIDMNYSADDYVGTYPENVYPPYGIYHGLGTGMMDGTWHTVTRDLQADLQFFYPDAEIERVLMFKIVGRSDAVPPPSEEAHTIGFWKNNIRKNLDGWTHGIQVEAGRMWELLDQVGSFYASPFSDVNGSPSGAAVAYDILSAKGPDPVAKLKKQLLASELNYFYGAYIDGGPEATVQFLMAGEDMILNPQDRSAILALKDLYDLFNNGGTIYWP